MDQVKFFIGCQEKEQVAVRATFETKCSRTDQVKFVEDNF